MGTSKALLLSLGITVVSEVILTFTRGMPTSEQAVSNGVEMFVVAFIVFKFIAPAFRAKPRE